MLLGRCERAAGHGMAPGRRTRARADTKRRAFDEHEATPPRMARGRPRRADGDGPGGHGPEARLQPDRARPALERRAAQGLEPDRSGSRLGGHRQDPEARRGQRQHQAHGVGPLAPEGAGSGRSLRPVLPAVRAPAPRGPEPRLRVRHQRGRLHRLEQPRGRRRERDPRPAVRRPRASRQGARPRSQDRSGPAEDRGDRAADDPDRRLRRARGGRAGHGHRQPLRARADRDHRHRERHGPRDRRRAVRRLHPDRRVDQPGQQRRAR